MRGVADTINAPFTSLYGNMRALSWPPVVQAGGARERPFASDEWRCDYEAGHKLSLRAPPAGLSPVENSRNFLKDILDRLFLLPCLSAKFSPSYFLGLPSK